LLFGKDPAIAGSLVFSQYKNRGIYVRSLYFLANLAVQASYCSDSSVQRDLIRF